MNKIIVSLFAMLLLASCTSSNTPVATDKKPTSTTPSAQESSEPKQVSFQEQIEKASSKIKQTPEFESCMSEQSNMCIKKVGMQIAREKKDVTFCKELGTPTEQSSCEFAVTMINATEKNDVTLCEKLMDANYQRQCKMNLYRKEASEKNDINACEKIAALVAPAASGAVRGGSEVDQCKMQVIMASPAATEADCEKLTETSSTDMCKMIIKNKKALHPDAEEANPIKPKK